MPELPEVETVRRGLSPVMEGRRILRLGRRSKYLLAELPSDCILDRKTGFKVDGWGFATVNIGTADDPDALITIAKSAGTFVTPLALGDARHGKPLWEQLGLAADPGGTIKLYVQGPANATGAGTMPFEIVYRYR
jgi:formamidopyrimidine-DNA glycosylase